MSAIAAPVRSPLPIRSRLSPVAVATGLLLGLLVLAGIAGPALTPHDPEAVSLGDRLQEPFGFGGDLSRPLGTDQLGRDVLSRVIAGARVSLLVAVSATALAGTLGTAIGLLGGYFGGLLDRITTWVGDVQMAVPFVVVAIGVAASVRPSALTVAIVLGVTGWATYARVARLAAKPLRRAPFVDAARVAGAGNARIAFRHVLPVILPPVLAIAGQQTGAMLLYEAALSFLGLGVPPGTITWGGMVADARETAQMAWWATVAPGVAIVLVVIACNAASRVVNQWTGDSGR